MEPKTMSFSDIQKWLKVVMVVLPLLQRVIVWPTNWQDPIEVQAWLHRFESELSIVIALIAQLAAADETDNLKTGTIHAQLVAAISDLS